MSEYIGCNVTNISGCIFQYANEKGENINFCYTFDNEYFTMYCGGIPVCFRFKDIKLSKDVEVYVPTEYRYDFDYDLMFNQLRQMLIEFPIVQYVKNSFPLDDVKLNFIKDNCVSLSVIKSDDNLFMLDIKLPDMDIVYEEDYEDKNLLSISKNFLEDNTYTNNYSRTYNDVIARFEDIFLNSGLCPLISADISEDKGMIFYLVNELTGDRTSLMNLHLGLDGVCTISNCYLDKSLSTFSVVIAKCLSNLGSLEFISKIVFEDSIDNKLYSALDKMGYKTNTGLLLPKASMSKNFS